MGVEIDFEKENIKIYNPFTYDDGWIILDTFNIQIINKDLIKIDSIVRSISCLEFEHPQKSYAMDGMHLEAGFYFSDGTILHNSPGNVPIEVYDILKDNVLKLVLKYNKSVYNQKIIAQIKEYN